MVAFIREVGILKVDVLDLACLKEDNLKVDILDLACLKEDSLSWVGNREVDNLNLDAL